MACRDFLLDQASVLRREEMRPATTKSRSLSAAPKGPAPSSFLIKASIVAPDLEGCGPSQPCYAMRALLADRLRYPALARLTLQSSILPIFHFSTIAGIDVARQPLPRSRGTYRGLQQSTHTLPQTKAQGVRQDRSHPAPAPSRPISLQVIGPENNDEEIPKPL